MDPIWYAVLAFSFARKLNRVGDGWCGSEVNTILQFCRSRVFESAHTPKYDFVRKWAFILRNLHLKQTTSLRAIFLKHGQTRKWQRCLRYGKPTVNICAYNAGDAHLTGSVAILCISMTNCSKKNRAIFRKYSHTLRKLMLSQILSAIYTIRRQD